MKCNVIDAVKGKTLETPPEYQVGRLRINEKSLNLAKLEEPKTFEDKCSLLFEHE